MIRQAIPGLQPFCSSAHCNIFFLVWLYIGSSGGDRLRIAQSLHHSSSAAQGNSSPLLKVEISAPCLMTDMGFEGPLLDRFSTHKASGSHAQSA